MSGTDRRRFLKVLGAAGAASFMSFPLGRALADPPEARDEFFIFIHASGGWDVTLWSDPRNERVGLVEPASTDNTDVTNLRRWVAAPLDGDTRTFELVRPPGSNITFGPAIGDLGDMFDRLTLVNGLEMDTVSHPDGTAFSATGRHLAGGHPAASSVDVMIANEFGREQLFPAISVQFPSSYVGDRLDPRAAPLRVGTIGTVARTLTRSTRYDTSADRDAVTALLTREAQDLATRAQHREAFLGLAQQYQSLQRMLASNVQGVFSAPALQTAYPQFNYRGANLGADAVNAAFAVESMRRNVVRCVSFAIDGFDTHNTNYRNHAETLQEFFDLLATLVRALDATPHPTRASDRLSDHTHILVVSDFCRTPQINLSGGRDHYPNNTALIISPRFRGNTVLGTTDREQVLPSGGRTFAGGMRAITPADVLATFVSAFGVDPRTYLRDGEVMPELLRT
jgi:hypothetical protein